MVRNRTIPSTGSRLSWNRRSIYRSCTGSLVSNLTLITGGARSGKSAYAERLAARSGAPVLYVATAEAGDEEMRARIEAHRATRPASWQTIEEPQAVSISLKVHYRPGMVVLLDCITLLVSNLLLAGRPIQPEIDALVAWQQSAGSMLIAVTNEVGLGVVPDNELARRYRDDLGLANQRLAAAATHVLLMVAGLPMSLK
ncbi:MAG: bifunctional adenosylcobinamide kinase/adenosylcobinamide-phosphate guanylyltransferase [Chloroflexi bacterium]|nr:bifunctional adenosylcobinamide kinase/adenosylcobinamide-phosphate guanylyltransferase [Chloroflexota bacterium]